MKKFAVIIFSALMIFALGGCKKNDTIKIFVPDGAPALSLVSVFNEDEIGGKKVSFTVVPAGNITSYVLSGEADLAIVPVNTAAIIYGEGYPYRLVSTNTQGNLYVVGKDDALVGKVVGVIGRGQVPDLIFRALLLRDEINFKEGDSPDDKAVTLYYASDGGVLIPLIASGKVDCGLLGEPAVGVALKRIEGAEIVMDIQKEWGMYPQSCLISKDEISDEFLTELFAQLRSGSVLDDPTEAQRRISDHMIESAETTVKSLDEDTIQRCNIRLVTAAQCKGDVMALLDEFYALDPQSVGGKLPDDNFFRAIE